MRTRSLLLLALLALPGLSLADEPYVPAPPAQVPGYFADVMPCTISKNTDMRKGDSEGVTVVECQGSLLDAKSLRELSIMRNTIFARYGWDGYRKPWLREYFHGQPWFKPNPKFSYKMLSQADRKNVHFVGVREQSFHEDDLQRRRSDIYARHGKVWHDVPEWTLKGGKKVKRCEEPDNVDPDADSPQRDERSGEIVSEDCYYRGQKWYRPDPKFTDDLLSGDERVELGLISRALGIFTIDSGKRASQETSLDQVLPVADLRQLSLRDLRLLRNTIYARGGRPFKSKILQDHFARMSWYKINPQYSDKLLLPNDVRNITLIKSVENEFGGPLRDEDWLIEPATDLA